QDAIETKATEARGVKSARNNALALSLMIGTIMRGCVPLAKRLEEAIQKDEKPNVRDGLKILATSAYIVKQGSEAIKLALEMERLRVGKPQDVPGAGDGEKDLDNMSPEELLAELERVPDLVKNSMH